HHLQLTSRDQFLKAGESYFGQGDWIIFQAMPAPHGNEVPDQIYSMYVARCVRDASKRITGIDKVQRISPPGSANTCGWFHPKLPGTVIFGSTLVAPSDDQPGGFRVGERTYKWMFPKEMDIVTMGVRDIFVDV